MTIEQSNALQEAGIDLKSGMARLMNNEKLYLKILKKFPKDGSYAKLMEASEQGDAAAAVSASHTLKGVCGNLAIQKLYELTTRQVNLFRAGDSETAFKMNGDIIAAYEKAVAAINSLE